MVTFTVDRDYANGSILKSYSYHKGELVNKYDSFIRIGSSVLIHSGDALKFTISRMTEGMALHIWDEEYVNGML